MTEEINDFGFTAHEDKIDEPEIVQQTVVTANTASLEQKIDNLVSQVNLLITGMDAYGAGAGVDSVRALQIVEIITPLLKGLIATSDKDWIHWPNRKPILEAKLQEIERIVGV